jgi:hypothetical protein
MMITSTKFLLILGVLLLATSSLTFGDVEPHDDHGAVAGAAATTGATTTGLRKTVRKLKSEKSSKNNTSLEQSYEFMRTKAMALEKVKAPQRQAKVKKLNRIIRRQRTARQGK